MDYKYITTFWDDFSIAEKFGLDAINDTAFRAFYAWRDNIAYLTELIMVLNHKCWYWYEQHEDNLASLYSELYYKYDERVLNYLEEKDDKEAIHYYLSTLD